jgi:hypothetical protein
MLRPFFFFCTLGILSLAACGGSSSSTNDTKPIAANPPPAGPPPAPAPNPPAAPPPPPAVNTIDAASADALEAKALCAYYARCESKIPGQDSEAVCETKTASLLQEIDLDGALYDADAVAKAVACINGVSCDVNYDAWGLESACPLPKPVNRLKVGAPCNDYNACESRYCSGLTDSTCGTCATPTIVAAGAACDLSSGTMCATDQMCIERCLQFRGLGETCDGDMSTLTTSSQPCTGDLLCTAGTCVKGHGLGGSCNDFECDGIQGVTCDATKHQCVAITWVSANGVCDLVGQRRCDASTYCHGATSTTPGTCQPHVTVGQPCDVQEYAACDAGSMCSDAGTCQRLSVLRPTCK